MPSGLVPLAMDIKRSKRPTTRRIDVKVGKHMRQMHSATHYGKDILVEHSRGREMMAYDKFSQNVGLKRGAAESLIKWLEDRTGKTLTNEDIVRLGFLDDQDAVQQHCEIDEKQYQIKRIVYASGERHGWERGRFYASEREKGVASSFWMMQFHSMDLSRLRITELNERCPGSPINSDIEDNAGGWTVALHIDKETRVNILDKLEAWLINHPDTFYHMTGPGNRGPSRKTKSLVVANEPVYCRSESGECVRATIINLINIKEGTATAKGLLEKGPVDDRCLGTSARWLEHNLGTYRLQKIELHYEPSAWFKNRARGLFIVQLVGIDKHDEDIEHAVGIDCSRNLVLDPVESHALKLEAKTLKACVGDGFRFTKVKEIRELVEQPHGRRSRKRDRKRNQSSRSVQSERRRFSKLDAERIASK